MKTARSPFLTLSLLAMVLFLALQLWQTRRPAPTPPLAPLAPSSGNNATQVYRRVSPSVVAVANHALVRRGFWSFQLYEVPQGRGSGFVWDKKGHIVSNYHVVYQASSLIISFPDGSQYEAQLIGIAPDYDLAVLKIDAPPDKLHPVEIAPSRDLEVGASVYAIGNPFGLDTTLSAGIISALGRTITSMSDRQIYEVIQTDTAINPGNSGGPLLSDQARLIGVNTAILSPSGANAGIGFAVPSDTVARVIPQLIDQGRVTRAGLGVPLLPDHITQRNGIQGVAIYLVPEHSAAARAGLEGLSINRRGTLLFGDVIIAVEGHSVATTEELRARLDSRAPGEQVTLTIQRGTQTREIKLLLVEE